VTALGEVDMGVGQVGDEEIDRLDHPARDVGVQVERRHDRDSRPDDRAYGGKQRALGIEVDGAAAGAMRLDVDAVDRERAPQAFLDEPHEAVEEALLDGAARAGGRHRERDWQPRPSLVHGAAEADEPAGIARHRQARVDDDVLALDPVLLAELGLVRDRGEGVRFEHEPDERDAWRHPVSSPAWPIRRELWRVPPPRG